MFPGIDALLVDNRFIFGPDSFHHRTPTRNRIRNIIYVVADRYEKVMAIKHGVAQYIKGSDNFVDRFIPRRMALPGNEGFVVGEDYTVTFWRVGEEWKDGVDIRIVGKRPIAVVRIPGKIPYKVLGDALEAANPIR